METVQRASVLGVVMPPFCYFLLEFTGLLLLSLSTQRMWWRLNVMNKLRCINPCQLLRHTPENIEQDCEFHSMSRKFSGGEGPADAPFLTVKEILLVESFLCHQNRPKALLHMAVPTLISLTFCLLSLVQPFIQHFFWPDLHGEFEHMPNVNDAMSSFLTPAGMVYAIAFGFAFQEALTKQGRAEQGLLDLNHSITELMLLLHALPMSRHKKLKVLHLLKEEILTSMEVVVDRKCYTQSAFWINREKRYRKVIRFVQPLLTSCQNCSNAVIHTKFLETLLQLRVNIVDRSSIVAPTLGILHWIFLESLGFITFLGILMTYATSVRLQIMICMLTVLTLSMFSYILTDLDHTQHGVFRVDMGILYDILNRIYNDVLSETSGERH